jgi:Acetyltransferase (GNAT) domain
VEEIATMAASGPATEQAIFTPISFALPDGGRLIVREMAEADAQGVWLLYEGLASDDRYHRFFALSHPSRDSAERWIRDCRAHGAGLVAVSTEGVERLVGEAGYVLVPNGDGEFALTVASDWRGWLGPYLLELLVQVAAARGVRNLEADILLDNRPMLSLVRHRAHATLGYGDFNIEHVVIGASNRLPGWPPIGARLRVLVEGRGGRLYGARELARAGFDVMGCPGPAAQGVTCPALEGEPCPLARGADAIVVALSDDVHGARVVAAHRRLQPDTPLVIEVAEDTPADDAEGGRKECRLRAGTPPERVIEALERLVDQP